MFLTEMKTFGGMLTRGVIVISGTGTDMSAVLEVSQLGGIPEVESWVVIGTRSDAHGLGVAKLFGIETHVVNKLDEAEFLDGFKKVVADTGTDFVIMLGNYRYLPRIVLLGDDLGLWAINRDVEVIKDEMEIPCFNIHPALPERHGGNGMKGEDVHIHVLEDLLDQLSREGYNPQRRYETVIVIHRAHREPWESEPLLPEGKKPYDVGKHVATRAVPIPHWFIQELLEKNAKRRCRSVIKLYAKMLQQHVLRHEWRLLAGAVPSIAWEIITENDNEYRKFLKKAIKH